MAAHMVYVRYYIILCGDCNERQFGFGLRVSAFRGRMAVSRMDIMDIKGRIKWALDWA